ncbi:ef hand family protein [Stylonychia lemnae]|uniref:Ef hand family protein n=1 Tax=Stylonychia lemnae TaxID=5949 RepID=A0A077ZXH0_STYLE|nr:ef hand family protein [Stylonychia lemnae]|eukprot:CDW74600.1 ef hand family protein [Stylonychia lemnae]
MERRNTVSKTYGSSNNAARIDTSKLSLYPLPGDMLADLQDAFTFYDKEDTGYITIAHFRNILHNFGFHNMSKKEIDDELKRADSQFLQKQSVDIDTVKLVIGYRWNKGGKEEEAKESFHLFDKRDRGYINVNEVKTVLVNYLDFPVNDNDIQEFMLQCDPNSSGQVGFKDYAKLYLS